MNENKMPETMALIRDNILQHQSPLAVSAKENAAWAEGLNLPEQGDLLFFTGGEYQLLPFIDSLMSVMDLVDPGSRTFSWMMGLRDVVHKTGMVPEKVFASVFAQNKDRFFSINRKAAEILLHLGYELAYDGAHEVYSGALLHELGFYDAMAAYSKIVSRYIARTGAKTVVCLSPHAAEVFKYVYPAFKDFPDVEIKTFPELVWARREHLPKRNIDEPVVIHDSCRLAREMGVVSEIRDILTAMNVAYVEPFRAGAWTTCCGGPVKMTYPDLAHKLAGQRCKELLDSGSNKAIVACPFCLSALAGADEGASLFIQDLVELIAGGYGL